MSNETTNANVETICGLEFKRTDDFCSYNKTLELNLIKITDNHYKVYSHTVNTTDGDSKEEAVANMLKDIKFLATQELIDYIKEIENYSKLIENRTNTINLINKLGVK